MKIHRFFDFRRQGAPFASQFLLVFYKKRAPAALGFGRALYKRKNERFFPPRKCQRGPLLSSLFYRGICPSDIKQACMFQKGPRGSANFFIFFKKKTLPSLGGFFLRQKRKSPRGSANPGRKKGRRLHGQFGLKTVDPAVQRGPARTCPTERCHPTPFGGVSSRAGPEEGTRS